MTDIRKFFTADLIGALICLTTGGHLVERTASGDQAVDPNVLHETVGILTAYSSTVDYTRVAIGGLEKRVDRGAYFEIEVIQPAKNYVINQTITNGPKDI